MSCYDEVALLRENAEEAGLPWEGPPAVRRETVEVAAGRRVSALVWGTAGPDLVLLHGGGQNAHTWDTVALALARPLVAVDLPGHGHSDWREDGEVAPWALAGDVATMVETLAPHARMVVGMSLGGLTAIAVTARRPDLVRRLALVDVTPGVTAGKSTAITDFLSGRDSFASFDEILAWTVKHNPTRTVSSLRRGIVHNAVRRDDGSWAWRHQVGGGRVSAARGGGFPDYSALWEDLSRIRVPLLLVRGALSPVVDDADVAELRRRQPGLAVEVVEGAGHSIQGDRPVELARILERFLEGGSSNMPGRH